MFIKLSEKKNGQRVHNTFVNYAIEVVTRYIYITQ